MEGRREREEEILHSDGFMDGLMHNGCVNETDVQCIQVGGGREEGGSSSL